MIELDRVTKVFNPGSVDQVRAVDDVSVSVGTGQFVTVIGSNGAGKSTLLALVAGVFRPDSGRVSVAGREVTSTPEHLRARVMGRVFQDPLKGTSAAMTVEENLSLAFMRGGRRGFKLAVRRSRRPWLREKLSHLGLGLEDRLGDRVGLLSGGQRQALTILMATIASGPVLLLDEHTAALDPQTAGVVLRLTKEVIAEGELTVFMVTHNMDQAITLGDRLLMMNQGRIILDVIGEEKTSLTVGDVMEQFSRARGEVYASDRSLLT